METNVLKLFAGNVIVSSSMPPEVKRNLINFVEAASDYQIKTFLLDAEMVADTDNDFARTILDTKFEISALPIKVRHFAEAGGRVAKLRKTYSSVWAAANTIPIWILYRKIRSIYDECTKKCGTYELNTSRRQHCMIKCKADRDKIEKKLRVLEKSKKSFKDRGAEVPE